MKSKRGIGYCMERFADDSLSGDDFRHQREAGSDDFRESAVDVGIPRKVSVIVVAGKLVVIAAPMILNGTELGPKGSVAKLETPTVT